MSKVKLIFYMLGKGGISVLQTSIFILVRVSSLREHGLDAPNQSANIQGTSCFSQNVYYFVNTDN